MRLAPAPWSIDDDNVLSGTKYGDEISDSMGNRVCRVTRLPTQFENASLISAAPELFDALISLMNSVNNKKKLNDAIEFAKDAIAKATGD